MSNIEWTDATWNPVIGCTPVSPGCLNCYAASMAIRLEGMAKKKPNGYEPRHRKDHERSIGNGSDTDVPDDQRTVRIAQVRAGRAVFTGDVRCLPDRINEPMKWRKPRRVFVNSMSDLFHEDVPLEFVDRVFAVMAWCPRHTFQVLTKRPERMAAYMGDRETLERIQMHAGVGGPEPWPFPNVWLGTSVERQQEADDRIPHLLRCPAAVRFLSCEPLLGPVDLHLDREYLIDVMDLDDEREAGRRGTYPFRSAPPWARTRRRHLIHWVIVGGESGPGSRPCDVEWIRGIVKQCKDAGVPCFVKQLGARIVLRNDSHDEWPRGGDELIYDHEGPGWTYQGEKHEARLRDPKGGNPQEWPEDLRVREWPQC